MNLIRKLDRDQNVSNKNTSEVMLILYLFIADVAADEWEKSEAKMKKREKQPKRKRIILFDEMNKIDSLCQTNGNNMPKWAHNETRRFSRCLE